MQYDMDATFEVYSYVDKSLMNVYATRQSGGCPKEGGKQCNMSMYESESNSKDKDSYKNIWEEKQCSLPSMMNVHP